LSTVPTASDLEKHVCSLIAEFGGIPPEQVTPSAHLEELDVDSLDLVELSQIVEEEHGIQLPAQEFEGVQTVRDVVAVVVRNASVT